jgi:hypothetical protein
MAELEKDDAEELAVKKVGENGTPPDKRRERRTYSADPARL